MNHLVLINIFLNLECLSSDYPLINLNIALKNMPDSFRHVSLVDSFVRIKNQDLILSGEMGGHVLPRHTLYG